jgi:hypothetical protein
MPSDVSVPSGLEKVLHSLNLRDVQDTGKETRDKEDYPFGVLMESTLAMF